MNHCPKNRTRMLATACSLALGLGGACVAQAAGNTTATPSDRTTAPSAAYAAPGTYRASGSRDAAHDAMEHVDKAVAVVHRMESEPHVKQLLDQAKGVFIIPRYGRAALGIGGRGGAGVLMVKRSGTWGNPAFYNYGGISAGVQAGVEGGAVAFVLNDDKAVRSFTRQDNNWSLNAEAGLTIVAWSDKGQGSAGKGDVTVWSDTKGLFGDLAISLTDMDFDENETGAYYGQKIANAGDVVNGTIVNPHANALQQALAAATGTPTPSASSTAAAAPTASSSSTTGGTTASLATTTPPSDAASMRAQPSR